jgi:hypothetical protein
VLLIPVVFRRWRSSAARALGMSPELEAQSREEFLGKLALAA